MSLDHLTTARAVALFASDLPNQCRPSQAVVEAAINGALTACGGVDACVGALAAAYGHHPETAAPRMKWALQIADTMRSTDRRPHSRALATRPSIPMRDIHLVSETLGH